MAGKKKNSDHFNVFLISLKIKTEKFLTWRKRRKLRKKEKLKKKNPVLDWVEAFLSAVIIVFFVNQYLIQAYQIPTTSMVKTLEIGDRIFVDKITYGPELLPGVMKLPGFKKIERGEIAIFESPEYLSKGPIYDIITRIVYMMTFSFIDLDRDPNGEPAKHFLIKRVVGIPGDRIRQNYGLIEILPKGERNWFAESMLKEKKQMKYTLNRRFFDNKAYSLFEDVGKGLGFIEAGLPLKEEEQEKLNKIVEIINDQGVWRKIRLCDGIFLDKVRYRILSEIKPNDWIYKKEWRKIEIGRYIPEGYILPLGDNRDNSRDGRIFGPVKIKKVLGKSLFRFWPFNRFGRI